MAVSFLYPAEPSPSNRSGSGWDNTAVATAEGSVSLSAEVNVEGSPPSPALSGGAPADASTSSAVEPYVLQTNAPVRMTFTAFTKESYAKLARREIALKTRLERLKQNDEGRLVNGEIVFDEEDDEDFLKTDFNPKLIEGAPLPEKFGRFPRDLYGKPIEEVDHYIKYKTFVVITKSNGRNKISRYSASNALFCLAPWNPLRKAVIWLVNNQLFDNFILLVITLNCITMALDPSVIDPYADGFEYFFLVLYSLEFILRAISRGFVLNKHAYLRDPWSYIDFGVILISYTTFTLDRLDTGTQDLSFLKVLRALRVLRAIKGISVIPGLRMIVNSVINSMGKLMEVFMLAFFIIIIFSLMSMQLYEGVFKQKCVDMTSFTMVNASLLDKEYSVYINNASNWVIGAFNDDWDYMLCGNESGAFNCSDFQNGTVCLSVGENPNYNYTHFDDFGVALLNIFQVFTMDHWEDVYNKLIRLKGKLTIFYFFLLIFFGSFYVINLILAVVRNAYSAEASEEARILAEEEAEEAARAKRNENTALLFDPKKLRERLSSQQQPGTDAASVLTAPAFAIEGQRPTATAAVPPQIIINDGVVSSSPTHGQNGTEHTNMLKVDDMSNKSMYHLSVEGDNDYTKSPIPSHYSGAEDVDVEMIAEDISALDHRHKRYLLQKFATLWLNKIKSEDDQLIDRNCLCCGKSGCVGYHDWIKMQNIVFKVATDGLFELFITLSIIANTMVMMSEYDAMSEEHRKAIEIANQVFTWVFTVEAIVKLIALSKEYFKVPWNLLDIVVVVFSLVDFILSYVSISRAGKKSLKSVSKVIKIFRLMRIIKLAQSWSTLRSLLEIVFGTLGALANIVVVLFIMMFLFAILGNQLLADNYNDYVYHPGSALNTTLMKNYNGVMPRWNFEDFPHSLLVVFHILCSSWIEMCWDCMNVNPGPVCPIIFIATLLVGQFLILNLFLALLLDAFSGDNIKKEKKVKEESKLKKSLMRIKHCFKKSSGSSKGSITPASFFSDPRSVATSKMTMRLPSLIVPDAAQLSNGSHVSMKSSQSHLDTALSVPAKSVASLRSTGALPRGMSRPELKPLGLTTDLITDGKENGSATFVTAVSNGVLHKTDPEISAMNLQNIEQAFQTHRDQYARFENAVMASQLGTSPMMRGPIIIAEDFSDNPEFRKTIFLHGGGDIEDEMREISSDDDDVNPDDEAGAKEEEVVEEDDRLKKMKEMEKQAKEAEQGEIQLTETGEIIVPNCCFDAVYAKIGCCNTACPSTWTSFRRICLKVSSHSLYDGFIMVIILLSSLALCGEDAYLVDGGTLSQILTYSNYAFTLIFIMEMLIKWAAIGLKNYLTSFWTILDGAIVVIACIDIISGWAGGDRITALKALRTFRGLRPLRAVSRWEGMKMVVNALIFAMPAIVNVLLVCLLFWLIFAIMGVQLFAGKFYACYDPLNNPASPIVNNLTWQDPVYNVIDMDSCLEQNLTWRNRPVNFDNVLNAYLALYQLATFEGWMEIMQSAVDSQDEKGLQPTLEAGIVYYSFVVLFILFGSFFSLNLFIGVIIDNFNMLKKQYDGSYLSSLLTESQRGYYNTLKKLGSKKPQKTIRRPKEKFLAFFFDIANHRRFDYLSMVVILLNMVVMIMDNPGVDDGTRLVVQRLNTVFTFLFCIEAIIKLLGYRAHYFRRVWNIFDLVIVTFSTAVEVLDFMDQSFTFSISPTMLRIIRVFRIGRILRLIKAARGVRKLLYTLIASIPGLFNIAVLLFLFMFIFSIIFMSQFMHVRINQEVYNAFTSTVNFRTFENSIELLFRLITVAGWNDVLNSMMVQPPYCNDTHYQLPYNGEWFEDGNGDCSPGAFLASFLMFAYLFLTNMIVVNMYIAVILESYDNANEEEQVGIIEDDIDMFYNCWETYDPLATQYIPVSQASNLIDSLEPPLRVPKPNGTAIVAFNLPITEGDLVHCLDLLMALVKRALHTIEENEPGMSDEQKEANDKLKQQIAAKYKAAFPQRLTARVISTTMQRKKEDVAAKTLQRAWRRHKMQRNIMRIKELALEQTQKEAAEEDARSLKRKLSNVIESARARIGSAVGRLSSRGSSMRSVRSIDSGALQVAEPSEGR